MAKRFKQSADPSMGKRPASSLRNLPTIDDLAAPAGAGSTGTGPLTSSEAPRPIDVDPAVTGSFSTIKSSEGALITDRTTAGDAAERVRAHRRGAPSHGEPARVSRTPAIIVAVLVGVFALAAFGLLWHFLMQAPATAITDRVEETAVAPGQPITYDGYNYMATQQENGQWAFVRTSFTSADPLVRFLFDGTPVEVVLYNGMFLIPQNLDGRWDVVAWVMGDGSEPTKLMGEDGQPMGGEGSVESATLDGETLELSLSDGSTQSIPLADL